MKTLVVLAGGKSTRMGEDKVFLPFSDTETFLEHLVREAEPFFDCVLISGGSSAHSRSLKALLKKGIRVVEDLYPEKGPMGGLVSVYETLNLPKFAVVPTDSPMADMEVLSWLYDWCGKGACLLSDEKGRAEPLCGAYGEDALLRMQKLLREGNFRLRSALAEDVRLYSAQMLAGLIHGKNESGIRSSFRNINTAEDYRNGIK